MTSLNTDYELLACRIAEMNRRQVKQAIMHFKGRFSLDFSEDYLDRQPVEKLRHILLAARIQQSAN